VSSDRTLIAVATYNEVQNLPGLVEEIFRYAPDADLLVVDDNSPDGTGRWCDEKASEDGRVHCLHRPGKLGLGTAAVASFRYAIENGYRYVVNLDADMSHHPRHLPELLAGVQPDDASAVDVTIGSRYIPGGGIEGWPWYRRWMSRWINVFARCMLGLETRDCSGSYRCYRTEMLRKIDLSRVRSRGYSVYEEVLWHLKGVGARFREVPIVFTDREKGRSKIGGLEAIAATWTIFWLGLPGLGFGRPRPARRETKNGD